MSICGPGSARYSLSDVMQFIKSITAKEMFRRFPEIKELLWGGKFWSDCEYISTVGEGVNVDVIRNCICKQGRKTSQLRLTNF